MSGRGCAGPPLSPVAVKSVSSHNFDYEIFVQISFQIQKKTSHVYLAVQNPTVLLLYSEVVAVSRMV